MIHDVPNPAEPDEIGVTALPDESKRTWQPATLGKDVFSNQPGRAWYRTTLPALAGTGRTLHFRGVDDKAVIFLNGKRLMSHEGWDQPFDVSLDSAWDSAGENHLLVLVENTGGGGYIWPGVALGLSRASESGDDPSLASARVSKFAYRPVSESFVYVGLGRTPPGADSAQASDTQSSSQ